MHTTESIRQLVVNSGLNKFGDAILFGSFVKTKGNAYNDIDLYIDCDESDLGELIPALSDLPFAIRLQPKYYKKDPIPFPTKPWPSPNDSEDIFLNLQSTGPVLHIVACSRKDAKTQPFYRSMIDGPHIALAKRQL